MWACPWSNPRYFLDQFILSSSRKAVCAVYIFYYGPAVERRGLRRYGNSEDPACASAYTIWGPCWRYWTASEDLDLAVRTGMRLRHSYMPNWPLSQPEARILYIFVRWPIWGVLDGAKRKKKITENSYSIQFKNWFLDILPLTWLIQQTTNIYEMSNPVSWEI